MMEFKKQIITGAVLAAVVAATALLVSPASAGEREDQLLAAMTEAYGGQRLMNLKTYSEDMTFSLHWEKQDWRPNMARIRLYKDSFAVDFERRKVSREYWQEGFGEVFHSLDLMEEGGGKSYDLQARQVIDGGNFGSAMNSFARFSMPMLVRRLHDDGVEITLTGTENIDGVPHNVLRVNLPNNQNVRVLYVDTTTNFITKVIRELPNSKDEYLFLHYRVIDGIAHPTVVHRHDVGRFSVGFRQTDWYYSQNVNLSKRFVAPVGFTAPPEFDGVDRSKVTIHKLADHVYHIGAGGGNSIFIDTGEYIIASGGQAGLAERFKEFKSASGIDKPLRYQVVSHHHNDHVAGLKEALDLGATLVTVRDHVPPIVRAVGEGIPEDRFRLVSGDTTLAGGTSAPVRVFDIQTPHVEHLLMLYVPSVKVVFVADHVGTNTRESLPGPNENRTKFYEVFMRMNLDADRFLASHSARILTLDEVRWIAEQKMPSRCYENRPICAQ